MISLDDLFHQISGLRVQLEELPSDAFDQRVRLRSQIALLHVEAWHLEDELPQNRAHMEAELKRLQTERDGIIESHVDPVGQSGSLTASVPGDAAIAAGINLAMDKAHDLSRLERHIQKLKERLTR